MVNNVASRSWRHEPWRHEPRELIPDPTTLQGEAINLHNAGSGISAAKSNPRNISGRSCFDSRIKVCCIF